MNKQQKLKAAFKREILGQYGISHPHHPLLLDALDSMFEEVQEMVWQLNNREDNLTLWKEEDNGKNNKQIKNRSNAS